MCLVETSSNMIWGLKLGRNVLNETEHAIIFPCAITQSEKGQLLNIGGDNLQVSQS